MLTLAGLLTQAVITHIKFSEQSLSVLQPSATYNKIAKIKVSNVTDAKKPKNNDMFTMKIKSTFWSKSCLHDKQGMLNW